jgi:hypothetical protein
MSELTEEQQAAIDDILWKTEESKTRPMNCIVCREPTYDRGLACLGPAPASIILYGICYPCKYLPDFENLAAQGVCEYLIQIGREDLLEF